MRDRPAGSGPSAFAAAFLSFLFPGLGHAYARRFDRAVAFAAPAVLVVALLAGLLFNGPTRVGLLAQLTSPTVLLLLLALNVLLLIYRAVAVLDAYRTAARAVPAPRRASEASPAAGRTRLLSVLGLVAVLLVLTAGQVAAARLNMAAYDFWTGISDAGRSDPRPGLPSPSAPASGSPRASATPAPAPTSPPWNGTDRLNILLIGSDARPELGHYFTDTLIVASVDPASGQIAMLSLPRDTENVPLPRDWPAYRHFGGVFPEKINTLYVSAQNSPHLFPGNNAQRGYLALKGALGELYQLDIKYYIEIDLKGFRTLMDRMGGVIVDVQMPVSDDHYPTDDGRGHLNLYIPPGIQHLDGAEALAYARARHKTSDFDRAQRQQRVLLSLRQQTDVAALFLGGNLAKLMRATTQAVHTDIPPELFDNLISLGQGLDLGNVRSLVFTPPRYQTECLQCYSLTPRVERIRAAVREAFAHDPQLEERRATLGAEGAKVHVLNGSGRSGQATRIAEYLEHQGLDAAVPSRGRTRRQDYRETVITVYNGAAARLRETIRFLEETFGVRAVERTDRGTRVDIVIITGSTTPDLRRPE